MRVAIIGGGAAGLFAATVLEKHSVDYTIFEREQRVGRKLIATGNGRCNLSNTDINLNRYHGDKEFADYAITNFNSAALTDYLYKLGILCTNEGEKIFPHSLQASSVLDMLRLAVKNIRTETEIVSIIPKKSGFILNTKDNQEFFDKVLVCAGGKASRKLSGGGSYNLLTDLGYELTELKPSIVQLKCEGTKSLEGIKINAEVTLDEKRETGEVLFTSYGLSGPPILQLSRDAKGKKLRLDTIPDIDFDRLIDILSERRKIKDLTLENIFTGIINKKLGGFILKRAEVLPFLREAKTLTDSEIKKLVYTAKNLIFEINDTNGFDNAQVTAGGIKCKDFDDKTMQSKKHKGLYAAGEILNIDGDCGGFNLHFAFSSAYFAAKSIIEN